MASINIRIDLDNAAFVDNPQEIERLFATAAFATSRMRRARRADCISLFDINGNSVGSASYNPGD